MSCGIKRYLLLIEEGANVVKTELLIQELRFITQNFLFSIKP
jgi:hypothetical protein